MNADPSRSRILIVDDEPAVRLTLELALAETPHQVESVETAEAALARLDQGPVDLMLVDKNLPGMNGVELIRKVRAHDEDVWCAMITGYPSADSAMEMLHLGVRGYLEKPFDDIYDVVRRVDSMLEARRGQKRLHDAAGKLREAVQLLPSAKSLRILVLSGQPEEREWLAHRTGEATDSVTTCGSVDEALATIRAGTPHLVVVDAALRQLDLFAFIRSARAARPDTSFAVICDTPSLRMLSELIDARATAVIARPLADREYRDRMAAVIRRLRMVPEPRVPERNASA